MMFNDGRYNLSPVFGPGEPENSNGQWVSDGTL